MDSKVMFTATALILVVAMVAIAFPNAILATPPPKLLVQYCLKGHEGDSAFCAPTHKECTLLPVPLGESGKCVRVTSK